MAICSHAAYEHVLNAAGNSAQAALQGLRGRGTGKGPRARRSGYFARYVKPTPILLPINILEDAARSPARRIPPRRASLDWACKRLRFI